MDIDSDIKIAKKTNSNILNFLLDWWRGIQNDALAGLGEFLDKAEAPGTLLDAHRTGVLNGAKFFDFLFLLLFLLFEELLGEFLLSLYDKRGEMVVPQIPSMTYVIDVLQVVVVVGFASKTIVSLTGLARFQLK